jgi:hypothetical protein
VKDIKPLFDRAIAHSEVMIVERILVRVLPELLQHGQIRTAESIEQADASAVPYALYEQIRNVAEDLTGRSLSQE